jgi:hypothetical protein
MVTGFHNPIDFKPVEGWELYQVTLDKYHVMFFFENGWQLLNVAHAFSYQSFDGEVSYTYEVNGPSKQIEVDRILRQRVTKVAVRTPDRLALVFENGDELTVHDCSGMCSWWFQPVEDREHPEKSRGWRFSDGEID